LNAELDIHSENDTPHDLIIPPLGLCEKTAPDVIGANDNGPKSKIEFYNGDCLAVMKTLPSESIDLIITSPPYNLGETLPNWRPKGERREPGYDGYDDKMTEEDYRIWQHKCLREMWRLLSPRGAIFYNHKPRIKQKVLDTRLGLIPPEIPLHQIIVWFTRSAFQPSLHHFAPAHQWLMILSKPDWRLRNTGVSGLGDVWDIAIERNNFHPYPFPVSLPQRIIETSLHNATVLDPFGGSGSTALAAKLCGKSCISIDQSAEYVGKARSRFGPDVDWQEGQVNGFDHWQTSYQHEEQLRSSSTFVLESAKKAFARTRPRRTAKDMLADRNKVIEGIDRTCEQIAVGESSPFRGWYEVRNAHAEVTLRWGQKKIELPHGEMETIIKRVDLGNYYLSLKQEVQAGNLDKEILNAKGSVKKRRKLSESKRVQMAERRKETLRARAAEASAGQIGTPCGPVLLPVRLHIADQSREVAA
jgi:site-specific DNA-methyltransferase (adenine-specific)